MQHAIAVTSILAFATSGSAQQNNITHNGFYPDQPKALTAARGDRQIRLGTSEPCNPDVCAGKGYFVGKIWTIGLRSSSAGERQIKAVGPVQVDATYIVDEHTGMLFGETGADISGVALPIQPPLSSLRISRTAYRIRAYRQSRGI